jgi:hypothetical protein
VEQGPLTEPVPLDSITLPPPRLDPHLLRELGNKFGATSVTSTSFPGGTWPSSARPPMRSFAART